MKKQESILVLVIVAAFMATALFLPGLVRADVIVDNPDATVDPDGNWSTYTGGAPKYGADCRYKAGGSGSDTATWTPDKSLAGYYKVYAWWITGGSRATNAPYTIYYNGGSETVRVNQKATTGQWNLLGTYNFATGTSGSVVLADGPDADGAVIADAIKLELAAVVVTPETDGRIKLIQPASFPIIIDQPGSYVLASNIIVPADVDGIQISADNVTLDLNGFSLIGPGKSVGASGSGIVALSNSNIAVINGTVRAFRQSGMILAASGQVKDIKAKSNGETGMYVVGYTMITSRATNNGTDGITVYYGTLSNCDASLNGEWGIFSLHSSLDNCTAYTNDTGGILARNSTITGGSYYANILYGIKAEYSTISNCTTNQNSIGIWAEASILTTCTAYDNSNMGLRVLNSTVANCTAINNGAEGIYVTDACIVRSCAANDNGGTGIAVLGYGCRIEGNNLRNNTGNGIGMWANSESYVIKNVASGNLPPNYYGPGDNYMPLTGDNANVEF